MNDSWQQMIEQNILEYVSTIDFKNPDFSIKEVKQQLKKIIGSEPNVRLKWNSVEKVNELLKASGVENYKEIIEKVEQIELVYMSPDNKPIPFKIMF